MRKIRKTVGIFDSYGQGKVTHIDFTYSDHIIVWVTYEKMSKAYLWQGS